MITYISKRRSGFDNQVDEVVGKELVHKLFDDCKKRYDSCIGLDTETNGLDILVNEILLLCIGTPEHRIIIDCCTLNPFDLFPEDYQEYTYVAQNAKFDVGMIDVNYGIRLINLYCTMVVDQRLYQNSDFEFDYYSIRKRHLNISNTITDEQLSFVNKRRATFIPSISQLLYVSDDVEYLLPIKQSQVEIAKEIDLVWFLGTVEMPLIHCLVDMEIEGILVHDEKWIANAEQREKDLHQVQCQLDELVIELRDSEFNKMDKLLLTGGKYTAQRQFSPIVRKYDLFTGLKFGKYQPSKANINWNSSDQVADVLARLSLPMPTSDDKVFIPLLDDDNKLIKNYGMLEDGTELPHKGWTTTNKIVEKFVIDNPDSPSSKLLSLVNKHAKILKEVTTYGYSFLEKRNAKTGRIHTVYRQTSTANARLSSGGGVKQPNKPNLQNLPRDNRIRHCVIPRQGYLMQTVDLTGAEVVIICDKAHDQKLYELAVVKDDAHSPIITNSWRHIFLFRACRLAKKLYTPDEYFEHWRKFADIGFDTIDPNDPVQINYKLFKEFVVDKKTNKEYRQGGKNNTFGSIYNMGPDTAAATYNGTTSELRKADPTAKAVNVTRDEAIVALWAIREFIPDTFKYTDEIVARAFGQGYLVLNERSKTRIWFPDVLKVLQACHMTIEELAENGYPGHSIKSIRDGHYKLTSKDEFKIDWLRAKDIDGQARNIPISGTQADMLKEAMVAISHIIKTLELPLITIMQIHDELVLEIIEDHEQWYIRVNDTLHDIVYEGPLAGLVPYVMTTVANRYLINVKMSASSEILPYWSK